MYSVYRPGVIVCTVCTDLVSLCVQCVQTWCHCVYSAYRPSVIVCTVCTDLVSLCVQCIQTWCHCVYSAYRPGVTACTACTVYATITDEPQAEGKYCSEYRNNDISCESRKGIYVYIATQDYTPITTLATHPSQH